MAGRILGWSSNVTIEFVDAAGTASVRGGKGTTAERS
jgi:hypothetical protein